MSCPDCLGALIAAVGLHGDVWTGAKTYSRSDGFGRAQHSKGCKRAIKPQNSAVPSLLSKNRERQAPRIRTRSVGSPRKMGCTRARLPAGRRHETESAIKNSRNSEVADQVKCDQNPCVKTRSLDSNDSHQVGFALANKWLPEGLSNSAAPERPNIFSDRLAIEGFMLQRGGGRLASPNGMIGDSL